jgi:N-methylhydantoinase A
MRVGIDIGGTFTDLCAREGGSTLTAKAPSTPDDFTRGVLDVLEEGGVDLAGVDTLVHGSTVGINALLQRSFPEPALVTTEGFRDVLEIGRYHRPRLYDPYGRKPAPLVARRNRLTVPERIGSDGTEVRPLDEAAARRVAGQIDAAGIRQVAVAFVNAYANGAHERRMAELLRETVPGVHVALSSEVMPKVRALPRITMTVLNAALHPVVGAYLSRLSGALRERGFDGTLWIVRSNGGVMSAELAADRPEASILSGPAAGVMGVAQIAAEAGIGRLVALDMGGTSCDVATIEGGEAQITTEAELDWDMPMAAPMVDVRSIGAGGGSIASIDSGGTLRVGPRSAGAVPGPACYGRGGAEPTVTDANLVLGLLSAEARLGGRVALDVAAARSALAAPARALGLSEAECAAGVRRIVNENMSNAVRGVLTARGRDPRDFVLVAYGGAAGLHACEIARLLGIPRVLLPGRAGVLSAFGCTVMDVRHDSEQTFYAPLHELEPARLRAALDSLERSGAAELTRQGIEDHAIATRRVAAMRYVGQSYELEVPLPGDGLNRAALEQLRADFDSRHRDVHGVASEDPVAIVNIRCSLTGTLPAGAAPAPERGASGREAGTRDAGAREVFDEAQGATVEARVLRGLPSTGEALGGPCLIELPESTVWLPPGTEASVMSGETLTVTGPTEVRS